MIAGPCALSSHTSISGPTTLPAGGTFVRPLPGREIEPAALQIFARPDLYRWARGAESDGVIDLALATGGRDDLRWRDVPRLWRVLSDLAPDVIVVNGWGTRDAVLAHAWCRWHGVARVLVSDSQEGDFPRSRWKERFKRDLVRGVGSAFVAGKPQRRYMEALGVAPAAIVDGCDVVDNAHFSASIPLRRPGGYRVLTVARWSPEKNLLAAGEAFLAFASTRPRDEDWCWFVVGYGPLAGELQRMASETSGGRIRLLGAKTYEDLPATFADADLYWQPSVREPWGLAVNEAMAAGLPVLVSNRCGCHEDLVTNDTGWLFDPCSRDDMVRALRQAGEQHDRWPQMGAAAAEHVSHWGLDRFTSGLLAAIRIAAGADADAAMKDAGIRILHVASDAGPGERRSLAQRHRAGPGPGGPRCERPDGGGKCLR